MSRARGAAGLLVLLSAGLGGCTGWLGLDDALVDRDLDGVFADDNCPDVANPDQADSNNDGRGDACTTPCDAPWNLDRDDDDLDDKCDPCIGSGPIGGDDDGDGLVLGCDPCPDGGGVDLDGDHLEDACEGGPVGADEDGDLVGDDVDNCPGRANPDQLALDDTDPLGDACDPGPGGHRPALFEPFTSLPPGWLLSGSRVVGGALELAGVSVRATSSHQDDATRGDLWIELPVVFPPGTAPAATVTVVAGDAQAGSALACRLGADGQLRLDVADGATQETRQVATAFRPGIEVSLRLMTHRATNDAPLTMWCEAGTATTTATTPTYVAPPPRGMLRTTLEATNGTCVVRYLWIIRGPDLVNPA